MKKTIIKSLLLIPTFSIIDFGSGTTHKLHNLDSSISIKPTFEQGGFGCGTRNSILNIWIK